MKTGGYNKMKRNILLHTWFILLFIFSLLGCDQRERLPEVDFNDVVTLKKSRMHQRAEINICVGSMITPKEGYGYYKALLDFIGESLKIRINFIEKGSYAEVNALLEHSKIDIAFVCGGPYIDGKDTFNLELLVAPQVKGETVYYSYIIVHKDSSFTTFKDLRGKAFVFVDPLSNSGKIYPTYLLTHMGETPETFFKEYIYSYAHDTSIRAVAEGIVDAGAVDSLIWNYLQKAGPSFIMNTRIIKISPAFGIPPVVTRHNLEKNIKEKIKQVLLNMHLNKKGKDILKKMLIDKFVLVDDSAYDSIREIKRYIQQ